MTPKKPDTEAVVVLEPEVLDPEESESLEEPASPEESVEEFVPVDTKAVVPVSGLSAYLAEVGHYPLLTREEEYELAVRLHSSGDQSAAARLVTGNLRLVVKIAMEFQRSFISVMDLIQEGNIGLMQAVARFDPFRGVKLSSYAAWWIRAYILRYILNNWRMVKIGTTQAQRKLFYNLQKEKERLEAQGFVPTTRLLAERLDVTEKEVMEMDTRLAGHEVSLDAPISNDSTGTVGDLTASRDILQDEIIARGEMGDIYTKVFEEFRATLKGKELVIYDERLLGDPPVTLQDIGDKYGITRERVRQIESRMMKKLREFFESRGVEPPDRDA